MISACGKEVNHAISNNQAATPQLGVHIAASGTRTSTGLFGGTTEEQVGGQLTCDITLSHSRLVFRDDQGKISVFVRAKE